MRLNKLVTIFFLVVCFGISAFAQSNSENITNPCRYGETDFVGELIYLNVAEVDIRDVMTYITQQFNCNFVIDDSIKEVPITVNLTNVPWNLALDAILQSQGLNIKITKTDSEAKTLRIYEHNPLKCESENNRVEMISSTFSKTPLYTEFIELQNIPKETKKTYFVLLKKLLSSSLSRCGNIEIDEKSNTLILTDVRENIETVKSLVESNFETVKSIIEILDNGETEK
jgi:type IV pilus assembly protein PilQ